MKGSPGKNRNELAGIPVFDIVQIESNSKRRLIIQRNSVPNFFYIGFQ
jgi:hypothetical protein